MASGVSKKTKKKPNAPNANKSLTSLGSLTDTTMQMPLDNTEIGENDSRYYTGAEQHSELSIEPTKL